MPPSFSNVNSRFPAKITEITHVIDVIQANQKREMRTGDKSRSGREAAGGCSGGTGRRVQIPKKVYSVQKYIVVSVKRARKQNLWSKSEKKEFAQPEARQKKNVHKNHLVHL